MKPWMVWLLDPRPPWWRSTLPWLLALVIVAFWARDRWWAGSEKSGGAVSWFAMSDGSALTWNELTDSDRPQTVFVKQQMSVQISFETRLSSHADTIVLELGDVYADPSRATKQ